MTVAADKANNLTLQCDENREEVLGSVTQETQSNDRPFSIQLRTSARVSKKLKLDSQNVGLPVITEKKGSCLHCKTTRRNVCNTYHPTTIIFFSFLCRMYCVPDL